GNPDAQPVAGVLAQARAVLGALVDVVDVVGDRALELALDLDQAAVGAAERRGRGRRLFRRRLGLTRFLAAEHALDRLDHARQHPAVLALGAGGAGTRADLD